MQAASELLQKVNLPPAGHYVVAVSGGADSMALLHLLSSRQPNSWRLQVAHLNHGVRPDAGIDENLVRTVARIHGLPFHSHAANLGAATEAKMRQARYGFLQRVASQTGATAIITAHHLDDRQETSLYNLMRGASRHGLSPMSGYRFRTPAWNQVPILRPLLRIHKHELLDYATSQGLPWREDSTNRDISITRNFIRQELLPQARLATPDFDQKYFDALSRLDWLNRQIDSRLAGLASEISQRSDGAIQIDRRSVRRLSQTVLTQVLVDAAYSLQPDLGLSSHLLTSLIKLARAGKTGEELRLSSRLRVSLGYASLNLSLNQPSPRAPIPPQPLHRNLSLRFQNFNLARGYIGRLQPKAVLVRRADLMVRAANSGDRIAPVGMSGTKKIQDLFTDAKIPRAERLSYPVVASYNGEVVWVPGLAVSRHFAVTPDQPNADCLTYQLL